MKDLGYQSVIEMLSHAPEVLIERPSPHSDWVLYDAATHLVANHTDSHSEAGSGTKSHTFLGRVKHFYHVIEQSFFQTNPKEITSQDSWI